MKILAPWLLFLIAVPAFADMEVYHPRHRTGDDLRPLVEVALGPEGSVAIDGNTGALVMIGSGVAIAQALELLALQDRKLRTVFVRHETRSLHDLEAAGHRVVWSVGGNDVRIGNVESTRSGAAVLLGGASRSGGGGHTSSVRVLEGEWAIISQGSEVTLPIGSHRYPDAVRVAADSGLEVRPRILGDGRVRLDLRPFQSRLRAGGAVAHQGATTTLVVTPGQPAVVGGIGRAASSASRTLAGGSSRSGGQRDSVLIVTATVDADPAE